MTKEQAFRIGKIDYPCFYDDAFYKTADISVFDLKDCFIWGDKTQEVYVKSELLDSIIKRLFNEIGEKRDLAKKEFDSQPRELWSYGSVNYYLFNRLDLKEAYIFGRLSSYSVSFKEDRLEISWANSFKSRDKFNEFMQELLNDKFPNERWSTEIKDGMFTCPATAEFRLSAPSIILNYLKNGIAK